MPEWLAILPPVLAIAAAMWKREVVFALLLGIWLSEALLLAATIEQFTLLTPLHLFGQGFLNALERCVAVFGDGGNTRVLLFGLIVGALIELMQDSGGVSAFVARLVRMGWTKSKRQASALATIIGTSIFVETSMSILASGVVARRLFDSFQMSRARLAFLVDSTSAPISILFLINGWGAYALSLIQGYDLGNPVMVLAGSVMFNFYPILILVLVWYTVITTRVHGPMKQIEQTAVMRDEEVETIEPTKARYLLAPLAVLILGVIGFMFYTGEGDFRQGSGSRSVLWSTVLATILMILLLLKDKVYTHRKVMEVSFQGVGKLAPVNAIMLLSFAIGASCRDLGTGAFVANLVGDFLPAILAAPLLFVASGLIAFTVGTSWGTFAIMIPIGIPLGQSLGIPPSMALSAILGGGVFGDHCSPISDTTVLSSLAAGCDHIDHVRTQLPYALTAGVGAILLYVVAGLFV